MNFGDKRLTRRFFRIMDALSAAPDKSIWTANGDRVEAKAAYRFFNNEAVSCDDLLRSVAGATVEKLRQIQPRRVLLIQDTTAVSFGLRKDILGMGYYCDSEQRGMLVHSCLALVSGGVPVGLLHQEAHTRDSRKETLWTREERKSLPVEYKENFRRLATLRTAHAELPADMERLTVCDREGDFYELFADAERLGEKFLVRLAKNRMITEGRRLMELLRQSPVKGKMELQIGRNAKEHLPSRQVALEYHYETVEIRRPARRREAGWPEKLTLTAIYVHEAGTHESLRWFLLANSEVATNAEAKERIGDYAQRCKIEEKQSRSFDGLAVLTLLYSVIALQMMSLLYMERLDGGLSASLFLDETESKVLYCAEEAGGSGHLHAPGRGLRLGEAGRQTRRPQRRRSRLKSPMAGIGKALHPAGLPGFPRLKSCGSSGG